jgi:hypothetical protein
MSTSQHKLEKFSGSSWKGDGTAIFFKVEINEIVITVLTTVEK